MNLRKRRDPEKEHPSWVCWGRWGTYLMCYNGMELTAGLRRLRAAKVTQSADQKVNDPT